MTRDQARRRGMVPADGCESSRRRGVREESIQIDCGAGADRVRTRRRCLRQPHRRATAPGWPAICDGPQRACAGPGGGSPPRRCSHLFQRRRHGQGAQRRGGEAAGRRPHPEHRFQGRRRTSSAAMCWPRSISATYQAQFDQAVAKKALDEVQLDNARRDLERYAKLGGNIVAEKTIDTQRALVGQLRRRSSRTMRRSPTPRTMLDYTTIVAPIDGRTGIRMVDEGNLVRASDVGIVMITEVKPISVLFTLPQQQLWPVNKALASGPVAVEAFDTDNKVALDRGTLQVVDNQVDPTTGTVRMKADFPNADMQLWPGQFVNVRVLIETLNQVVVVPTPAVQRGPNGTFAYVVQDDDVRGLAHHHGQAADRDRGRHRQGHQAVGARRHDRLCPPQGRQPRSVAAPRISRSRATKAAAPANGRHGRAKLRTACAADARSSAPTPSAAAGMRGCLQAHAASFQRPARRRRAQRRRPAARRRARPRKLDAMSVSCPFIHRPDRHVSARPCGAAGRDSRLLVAAGLVAAAGRFPDHPGHDAAAGRQPRNDGQPRHGPARAPVRADPVAGDHDVVVGPTASARSRCSSRSTAISMRPPRTCSRPSTRPARRCRATCPIRRPTRR